MSAAKAIRCAATPPVRAELTRNQIPKDQSYSLPTILLVPFDSKLKSKTIEALPEFRCESDRSFLSGS